MPSILKLRMKKYILFWDFFLGDEDRKKGFQRRKKRMRGCKDILTFQLVSLSIKRNNYLTFPVQNIECVLSAVYLRTKLTYRFIFGTLTMEVIN